MSKNGKNDFFKDLEADITVEEFKQKKVVCENEKIRLKDLIAENPKYDIDIDEEDGVSRDLHLDMLGVLEDEAFFIFEFQKKIKEDDLKRFTYEIFLQIQEKIEKFFKRDSKFKQIKKATAIVLTKYDLLEKDRPRYWFDRLLSSRDSVTIDAPFDVIFVNTENKNPETALGRLMSDLSSDNPDEMYYDEFRERMKEMQEKPEEYIQASENYYDGIRIDLSEGIKQKFNEFRAEVEKHIAGEVEQKARADTLEKQMKGILESFIQNGENLETLASKTGYSIDKLKELLGT